MRLPALIELYPKYGDVQFLTDESRQPVSIQLDIRSVDKQLASGRKKKFLIKNCSTFDISWDNVAANASMTYDGFCGRDEIRTLAYSTEDLLFTIRYDDDTVMTDCEVFVSSYSEEIVFRRGDKENWRYRISLNLEQVF